MSKVTRLCSKCQSLKILDLSFHVHDTWSELENRRQACDFCQLRWELAKDVDRTQFPILHFQREESMIKLNEAYPPVLSICRNPKLLGPFADRIQIAFAELPDTASQTHFAILRQWITHCNENHYTIDRRPMCRPDLSRPPSRLLDVGSKKIPTLRIHETCPSETLIYIALSHPWGPGPYFCTFTFNLEEFKKNIPLADLPATFQDAITVTRELGVRYLWIDSLCIIQGKDGDFDQESKRMEDVFSSAYCVIAANNAEGQADGFLKPRDHEYKVLTFEQTSKPAFYIRRYIDDFENDVLESRMNKRGWVLQERALARRTIYFSKGQTYWECGGGVRCETLCKMDNKLASFLGDPSFPSKLSSNTTDRGERIKLYEDLYRQYSRLGFTRPSDRPIAIAGLEGRLRRDLRAQGDFGVFDDGRSLLQRSLLWRRGAEVARLTRIDCTGQLTPPPSWSWMAYEQGIDYLELPLGYPPVVWLAEIRGPWAATEASGVLRHTEHSKEPTQLEATARKFRSGHLRFNAGGEDNGDEFQVVYDVPRPSRTEGDELMCVVMGRTDETGKSTEELTHYVLLVTQMSLFREAGRSVFERVGVGKMVGKLIELGGGGIDIRIR